MVEIPGKGKKSMENNECCGNNCGGESVGAANDLLKFQINRQLIMLTKQCLFLLEDDKDYALKLEEILKEMGINNLDTAGETYQKNRKYILGISNDIIRDLQSLVEKLDIRIKS